MENVRPIRNEVDYDWALAEVERYFAEEPKKGTPDADRFDVLVALITAYESECWAIEPADPIDAIKAVMEAAGYTQADLAKIVGGKSRASEILSRRRPLTMKMAHALHAEWHIPADVLIQPAGRLHTAAE